MVEPHDTASSGEIIDAFDTDADLDSRQQDIIIHQQSIEANAFVLPSGLRLVPIETVAAVVEVKLSLTAEEFALADTAAAQTSRLLLSLRAEDNEPTRGAGGMSSRHPLIRKFNEEYKEKGAPLSHPDLLDRTTFAVFGIEGVTKLMTLGKYVMGASAVRLLTCLDAGSVLTAPAVPTEGPFGRSATAAGRQDALLAFAHWIGNAVKNHRDSAKKFSFKSQRYYESPWALYWKGTGGFEMPEHYKPTEEELRGRKALFPRTKFKR